MGIFKCIITQSLKVNWKKQHLYNFKLCHLESFSSLNSHISQQNMIIFSFAQQITDTSNKFISWYIVFFCFPIAFQWENTCACRGTAAQLVQTVHLAYSTFISSSFSFLSLVPAGTTHTSEFCPLELNGISHFPPSMRQIFISSETAISPLSLLLS